MPRIVAMREPNRPRNSVLQNAHTIFINSIRAAYSFLHQFETSRRGRRGAPTDAEQDLLRAMLTFASSGLDSMVKQLVRDALPQVIEKDDGSMILFSERVEKSIFKKQDTDTKLLTKAILSDSPRKTLIENFINELTENSLQSAEELLRIGAYFNIASGDITTDVDKLKQIFRVRNQISHEMDIDFTQSNRSRRPRRRDKMISYTNDLLKIGKAFLEHVDRKLTA
jgi:hypothetical protein